MNIHGHWHTVFTRCNRWSKKGRWEILFSVLSEEADFEYLMIDTSGVVDPFRGLK